MVNIHLAYTSPINSPSGPKSTPQLTLAQVWAGLQRKVRAGQDFVPVIVSTDVIEEYVDGEKGVPVVVREVVFQEGVGPAWAVGGRVREVCRSYEGCKVDFSQSDGSTISNIISHGPDGELMMTYAFEWLHPEVDAEDAGKVDALKGKHMEMARTAVEKSIDSIRRMVKEGVIVA